MTVTSAIPWDACMMPPAGEVNARLAMNQPAMMRDWEDSASKHVER
jgi:hypothetical protein